MKNKKITKFALVGLALLFVNQAFSLVAEAGARAVPICISALDGGSSATGDGGISEGTWSAHFLETAQKLDRNGGLVGDREAKIYQMVMASARAYSSGQDAALNQLSFGQLSSLIQAFAQQSTAESKSASVFYERDSLDGRVWEFSVQGLGLQPISAYNLVSSQIGQSNTLAIVRLSNGDLLSVHNIRSYDGDRLRADVVLLNGSTSRRSGGVVTYAIIQPNFHTDVGASVLVDMDPLQDAPPASDAQSAKLPYVTSVLRLSINLSAGQSLSAFERNLVAQLRDVVGDVVSVKLRDNSPRTIFVLNKIVTDGPESGFWLGYLDKGIDGFPIWSVKRVPFHQVISAIPSRKPFVSPEKMNFHQGASLRLLFRYNDRDAQDFRVRVVQLEPDASGRVDVRLTKVHASSADGRIASANDDIVVPLALIRGEPN